LAVKPRPFRTQRQGLHYILAALDVLVVNEHEVATILGGPPPNAQRTTEALRDLRPRTTVVTA
jgi:sugar/nucleoside kinase (ribokinase family)